MKFFKTIDEQIEILKSRGLILDESDNYKKVKQYLLTNNYYDVINGYARYFLKNTNSFEDNVTFNEITFLYEFDTAIRNTLFNSIILAEKHLRGLVAYYISEECHKQGNIEFYKEKNFYKKDPFYLRQKIWKIIDNNKNSRHDNSIRHHYLKYQCVPFWVIVNYLTFKDIYEILVRVPTIQNKVAKDLLSFIQEHLDINKHLFTPEVLLSFIYNIYEVRNVCAHGNRLIEYSCKNNVKYFEPLHIKYNIKPDSPKQSVYDVFLILQCFLSKTEYAILHNTIRKRMNYLENKLESIDYNIILTKLGFPNNWNRNNNPMEQ